MVDPAVPGLPWERDEDHWLEVQLARTRARRARAARLMVGALVVPLAAQAVLVWLGAASRWGLIVVALPLVVVWTLARDRR